MNVDGGAMFDAHPIVQKFAVHLEDWINRNLDSQPTAKEPNSVT